MRHRVTDRYATLRATTLWAMALRAVALRGTTLMAALLLATLSAVSATTAFAQQSLTLGDAVAAALTRHPSVALAEAGVEGAAAGRREVQASLLPALSVEGSLTRFQEPMVVAPFHGFDPQSPPLFDRTLAQAAVTMGYTVFDGGSRRARLDRASAAGVGAAARLEQARQALVAEVALRYAAALVAREQGAAHRSKLEALEEERSRATQLLEQGRVARVVLLRAEAALSAARAEAAAVSVRGDAAERELARLMGVESEVVSQATLAAAEIVAETPSRDAAIVSALHASPELRRLSAQVDVALAGEAEASSQWWPRVHLGGRYVQYGSGQGDAGGEWQTGVQLSYPVFTAGARPAAAARARAEASAGKAELALGRLRVAEAVDRAIAAATAAEARSTAWRTAVEQMEEVTRIERLALDTGAGLQTDYLAAQSELLRARAALTEARYDELSARVELARIMGELTMAWIRDNVESGR